MSGSQHACYEDLLARQLTRSLPELCGDVVTRDRLRLLPLREVVGLCRERSNHGLVEVSGDHELVGMKETLITLVIVHTRPLVRVTLQLIDRFGGRLCDVRALALDDDQWNAIYEQHDIGDHVLVRLTAGLVDPELIDRQEVVALRVLPIDVLHRPSTPAVLPLHPIDRHPREEEIRDLLICLNQPQSCRPKKRRLSLSDTTLVEPLVSVPVEIDAP